MIATFMTKEELTEKGFKQDYPHWYKGNRHDPIEKLRLHFVDNLAGEKVRIAWVSDPHNGNVGVVHKGVFYEVPTWVFKESVIFKELSHPKTFEINGDSIRYAAEHFEFPCALSNLDRKTARRVAKWVLEVSK